MKDNSCIFCRLANGDIPTHTLYEDELFRVILDASPATKGHALILPKKHYRDLYEIDASIAGKAMELAQKLSAHLTERLGCEGLNIVQNNGEVAGQTVFHFHLHLIPRYKEMDNSTMLIWEPKEVTTEEQKALVEKLKINEIIKNRKNDQT